MSSVPSVVMLLWLPLAAAVAQQPTQRRIAPAAVNPRITNWTADHFVWLEPKPGTQIMLLLPGTNGRPVNFRSIGSIAAQQGYRAIGLMYPDDLAVNAACASDRDRECMARMREEIIQGVDRSAHVAIDRDNGIERRLADLLRYLAREFPSEDWEGFLTPEGTPRWDRIAVGGFSQGGGHAAYIAKLRAVPRVVMFGAPADGIRDDVAPWMKPGATTVERFFAFRHERDPNRSISPNWHALGLDRLGGVKSVDEHTADFGGAHVFTTDLLPATGSYEQAHPSVFGDGATPRRPDGTPVFDAIWRYLLGAPTK